MYLLGIDNGGSDIKCAVYDLNGKELADFTYTDTDEYTGSGFYRA